MLRSKGLRLSFAGGAVIAISILSLLVLPKLIAGVGMMIGACGVGGGFIWTMLEFYLPPSEPPQDPTESS
jgi:hypothetical protein